MKKLPFLLCALLAVTGSAQVASVERTGKLPNGLTYYIRHNDSPSGMAEFHIIMRVGAANESDRQQGMAHFVEHMAFNGTKNFPSRGVIDYMEGVGVKYGPDLNAQTGIETTTFIMRQVPMVREGVVDSVLLILRDWAHYINLGDNDEIDRERGVVIEELRGRNNSNFRTGNRTRQVIYNGLHYGRRNIIGSQEQLSTFPHEELRKFYRQWYRPEQQAVVIVGDFDVEQMETKVRRVLGALPRGKGKAPVIDRIVPDNNEPLVTVETDPDQRDSRITLYIKRRTNVDAFEQKMVSTACAMVGARLDEISRRPNAPIHRSNMGNVALSWDSQALAIGGTASNNDVLSAWETLFTELERIRRHGFSQSELDTSRNRQIEGMEMGLRLRPTPTNSDYVVWFEDNFLRGTPVQTQAEQHRQSPQMLERMTVEQLNALMARLITPTNNVLVVTAPSASANSQVPTPRQLLAVMERVRQTPIAPWQPTQVEEEKLIVGNIAPGRIVSEEAGVWGSIVWALGNGVRVVVKPVEGTGGQLSMRAHADGGIALVDSAHRATAAQLIRVVEASGLGELTEAQLDDVSGSKNARTSLSLSRFATAITGNAVAKNAETMLQQVYLRFTAPRFDSAAFGGSDVDFDKLRALYSRFWGNTADSYTFFFAGDTLGLRPLVERYIASLPTGGEQLQFRDDGVRKTYRSETLRQSKTMRNPVATVECKFEGGMEYTLHNVAAMNFLCDCLTYRYAESIREEKGGTYGVSVSGWLGRQPVGEYSLMVSFRTNPALTDELLSIVEQEFRQIAANGPRADDMTKAREYRLKLLPQQRTSAAGWLDILATHYTWGGDLTTLDAEIATMTADDVRAVARKILDDGNITRKITEPQS